MYVCMYIYIYIYIYVSNINKLYLALMGPAVGGAAGVDRSSRASERTVLPNFNGY